MNIISIYEYKTGIIWTSAKKKKNTARKQTTKTDIIWTTAAKKQNKKKH